MILVGSMGVVSHCKIFKNNAAYGGGIYISLGSPIIKENYIIDNIALLGGGGIDCYRGNPIISYNIIANNKTTDTSNNGGGGIFSSLANPSIVDNYIYGNITPIVGGAILCWLYPEFGVTFSVEIRRNRIIDNSSAQYGGAIYISHGNINISDNYFKSNWATLGGGAIWCGSVSGTISNNIIENNSTDDYCGGISILDANVVLSNNSIIGNSGGHGGGAFFTNKSKSILFNNLFWNNIAPLGKNIYIGPFNSDTTLPCSLFIEYNNIDSSECLISNRAGNIFWGNSNIDFNPIFRDTLFHFSFRSPCIDAGAESLYIPEPWDTVIYAPTTDIEGNYRPIGADVDIGAYEYDPTYISENFNKNIPNLFEISTYPNPFNSSVNIKINYFINQTPTVKIYNINGQCVWAYNLGTGSIPAQTEKDNDYLTFVWQPDKSIPAGIYFVSVKSNNSIETKKIILLK